MFLFYFIFVFFGLIGPEFWQGPNGFRYDRGRVVNKYDKYYMPIHCRSWAWKFNMEGS